MVAIANHWQSRFRTLQQSVSFPILTFAVAAVLVLGILVFTHNSLAVCLLMIVPVVLLSLVSGWWAGALAGITAAVITAPYAGEGSSFIKPVLNTAIWPYLSLCYIGLGVLTGVQSTLTQRRHERKYADMEAKLMKAQASTRQYAQLLDTMTQGQDHLNRVNQELALLNAIATTVNSSLDLHHVQTTAMAQIGLLLEADEMQLFQIDEQGEHFVLQSRTPAGAQVGEIPPVSAREGLLGRMAQQMRVARVSVQAGDLDQRPPTVSVDAELVLAVPLRAQARLVGALVLVRNSGLTFSDDDMQFLESVGRMLAGAVENANLFRQTQEMSLSDELTGLGNRRFLNLRLKAEVSHAYAGGDALCFAMFDLDYFKRVNDQYGHPAGDAVLQQFAQRLQDEVRSLDLVCRLGGEEFALVAVNTPLHHAQHVVERICRNIAAIPFALPDGRTISITVSAGVATLDDEVKTAEQLMKAADEALYAAKEGGRNQVQVYHRQG